MGGRGRDEHDHLLTVGGTLRVARGLLSQHFTTALAKYLGRRLYGSAVFCIVSVTGRHL
jgi:hypothetical protein